MSTAYALPVGRRGQSGSLRHGQHASNRKRARDGAIRSKIDHDATSQGQHQTSPQDLRAEYQATLTPEERTQRRVAGQNLLDSPPSLPFPHASFDRKHQHAPEIQDDAGFRKDKQMHSLQAQHLGAMMALLHQCMLRQDFKRAYRALTLILHGTAAGHLIDIRSQGVWGIAGEVLLMRGVSHNTSREQERELVRRGFADAKKLYELMIVQYPHHRTWQDHTNAVDFHLAMFNIWIHVVQQEMQNREFDVEDGELNSLEHERQLKRKELEAAKDIGARMDTCLAVVPYSDNQSLTRLRAMVALWMADLLEFLSDSRSIDEHADETNIEQLNDAQTPEISKARDLAHRLLEKVRDP